MLMRLDLELTTEAVGPTVAGGGAMVVVEVVDPGEENSEGIRLLGCCEDSLEELGLI